MKKLNLPDTIDFLFINLLTFLMLFVWIKYFSHKIWLSVLISLVLMLLFNLIRSFILSKKRTKKQLTKSLQNDIEQYMYRLISNSRDENLTFFAKLLESKNPIINKTTNSITIGRIIILPMFESFELTLEQVLKTINSFSNSTDYAIIFLCVSCQPKAKTFLEKLNNFKVLVYEKNDLFFKLFQEYNYYPPINYTYKGNKKLKFKELITISFNRKRVKGYFLSGVLILFCSFIVKHNFYYVFMSSMLFLFSLISFIKKEVPTNNVNKNLF